MTSDAPLVPTHPRDVLEDVKIRLLTEGVRLRPAALAVLTSEGSEPLSVHEYPTTGGITLELAESVYVNAPFDGPLGEGASCELDAIDGSLVVRHRSVELPVKRFVPLPGYLTTVDSQGRVVTDVAMSHTDRVRLSPIVGCAYDCAFCDLPGLTYQIRPVEQLIEALQIAQADRRLPVRHVLISGGSPRKPHYDEFERLCHAVIIEAGMPVDIMMSPLVDDLTFIDRMVDAGVDGFSINIEMQSERAGLAFLGMKYRTTRRWFEDFLAHAVKRTGGGGRVRSLIIPGLESIEDTLAGVEFLASLGCDPVLSPFRPAVGTKAVNEPAATRRAMVTLLHEARQITEHYGVSLGPRCLPCQHNTLTLPWDVTVRTS